MMSRSSVLKTLFSDFESHSFSHRNSKTREDLWATYACGKNSFGKPTQKREFRRERGAIFKLRYGWKNRPGSENIFSESSRRQDCETCKGTPSLDVFLLFYCIWCVFSGGSRPFLGSLLGGHIFSFKSRNFFRGLRSHFLVPVSELFLEGCVYIFSPILGVQTPALDPPQKTWFWQGARTRRSTENVSVEAFLVDLCLATVTSCNER